MIIRQELLFSFEELQKFEPKSQLEVLFENLDLTPCLKMIKLLPGRPPYPRAAMLRALIAQRLLSIPTFSALAERLQYDLRFRYACGFDVCHSTPSVSAFSRFFKNLSRCDGLLSLFRSLARQCLEAGLADGTVLAIDSSALHAHEKPWAKDRHPHDGQCAEWGHKKDSHGKPMTWYGYKIHAAVDAGSGLPMAMTVTPANEADSAEAIPLMEQSPSPADYYCMDKGYDAKRIYEKAAGMGGQAVIPLNLRNEKQPPEGLSRTRTPVCSMGYEMPYWGCDKKAGTLKFRCPHVLGKVDCPQGSNWCSSSDYGCVVKKHVADDPRSFCLPHRGSREWKKLYNLRSSAERLFSRGKEKLGLDNIRLRGAREGHGA